MKIIPILYLITLFGFSGLYGQTTTKKEQKQAIRVAVITKRVGITPKEATAFWPVYNAMQSELKTLRKNARKFKEQGKRLDELTDEEIEQLLNHSFEYRTQEIAIRKKYHAKFKAILPIKKVAKLYHVDRRLHHQAKKEMEKKRR